MPFISTPEWVGIRRGLLEGIEWGLDMKFGAEGLKVMTEIRDIHDLEKLRAIGKGIKSAATPDDVRRVMASGGATEGT
ncbi:MAG TPA: hypothetical protein VKA46_08000 [Gemmataceae bacterium]|nr:hypothetical protein [Gemmataceae bacterium]